MLFADGTICNVEIQKIGYAFPGQRSTCYSADLLLRQYKAIQATKVKAEDFSRIRESEDLDKEQLAMERVMLGLRTSNGVEEEFLMAHCDRQAVEKAFENGHLLRTDGRRVRIPESSFFISDNIIGSII